MALKRRKYPSKLLLFGEYGVLVGLDALAMPYPEFSGRLEKKGDEEDEVLRKIFNKLTKAQYGLPFNIDLTRFENDIKSGLTFNSEIPLNYGLGSSGALAASIFDNYFEIKNKKERADLRAIKTTLSFMESPFQGISSGIDPLVSLTRYTILVRQSGRVIFFKKSVLPHRRRLQLFLVDSNLPGKRGDMVTRFIDKLEELDFSDKFRSDYQKYSNNTVSCLINKKYDKFYKHFKELSAFQFKEMHVLIPDHIKTIFRLGLESDTFALKICGSGGGGFFLGVTDDKKKLKEIVKEPIAFL